MSVNIHGEIRDIKKMSLQWKLEKFSQFLDGTAQANEPPELTALKMRIQRYTGYSGNINDTLWSPTQRVSDIYWQMMLIRKPELEDYINIHLILSSENTSIKTNASFSILDVRGIKRYERVLGTQEFLRYAHFHHLNFITCKFILEKKDIFLPNDELTILCELYPGNYNLYQEPWCDFGGVITGNNFSDIKLLVNAKPLYAHKVVLANRSDVFAKNFTHSKIVRNKIKIAKFKYEVIVELLRFMYTGEVKGIEKIVLDLFIAAHQYAVIDLKSICENYMFRSVTKGNAIKYLDVATRNECSPDLAHYLITFVTNNAHDMVRTVKFKSIMDLKPDILFIIIVDLSNRTRLCSEIRSAMGLGNRVL